MAGERIQAIIAPIDADLEELKKILGPEQFRLFAASKAEKFDTVILYSQAPQERFKSLEVADLGSGFKATYGQLRYAEKGDGVMMMPAGATMNLYPVQSGDGDTDNRDDQEEEFCEELCEKLDALKGAIAGSVELRSDVDQMKADAMTAITAFSEWVMAGIEGLRDYEAGEDVNKSDARKSDDPYENAFGSMIGKSARKSDRSHRTVNSRPTAQKSGEQDPYRVFDTLDAGPQLSAKRRAQKAEKMREHAGKSDDAIERAFSQMFLC